MTAPWAPMVAPPLVCRADLLLDTCEHGYPAESCYWPWWTPRNWSPGEVEPHPAPDPVPYHAGLYRPLLPTTPATRLAASYAWLTDPGDLT